MQILLAALLATYFLFFLIVLGSSEFLIELQRITATEWIAILGSFAALALFYFVRYRSSDGRLKIQEKFWISIVTLAFIFLTGCIILAEKQSIIYLTAAFFATAGWLYTNFTNTINQRKAHTMNVLIQMRNSAEFQKHRLRIAAKIKPIKEEDLQQHLDERADEQSYKDGAMPLLDSVVYILNYYEFISVGVEAGDLDETMIFLSLRAIFITFHDHVEPYIRHARKSNPRIFVNFVALVQRYRKL